jgi:eukaryotic-like serine/threonine-protein kinase
LARTPLRADDPSRVGHYRLTARLGAGGMGVVYLGVSWDGSPVAIKVLRPDLADSQEFRQRFGREVDALVRVKSACTVRVIEADSQSATPFMVTEYAEGPSLHEYLTEHGTLSPDMLQDLATGLAEALTVIHAAGIVHRDLKPSNIILTASGPKVIDFGIARRLDMAGMTKTGMMVGSTGFMAPEQISGQPGREADIFIWGVTVAYAASGQSPFGTGNAHAFLYRVMYGEADIAAVPDLLRPMVRAALTKEPEGRPTARQLFDRLSSLSPRAGTSFNAATQVTPALVRSEPGRARQAAPPRPAPEIPAASVPAGSVPAPARRSSGPLAALGRRAMVITVSAVVLVAAAVIVAVLLT